MNIKRSTIEGVKVYEHNQTHALRTYYQLNDYYKLNVTKTLFNKYQVNVVLSNYTYYGILTFVLDAEGNLVKFPNRFRNYQEETAMKYTLLKTLMLLKKINITNYPFDLETITNKYRGKLELIEEMIQSKEGLNVDTIDVDILSFKNRQKLAGGQEVLSLIKTGLAKSFEETISTDKYRFQILLHQESTYNNKDMIMLQLKVGKDKLYVVKNLRQFILNYLNKVTVEMSKKFTYTHDRSKLDEFSSLTLDFLEKASLSSNFTSDNRYLVINQFMDVFYELIQHPKAKQYIDFDYETLPVVFSLDVKKTTDHEGNELYNIEQIAQDRYVASNDAFYHFQDDLLTKYTIGNIKLFKQILDASWEGFSFNLEDYLNFIHYLETSFGDCFSKAGLPDLDRDVSVANLDLDTYIDIENPYLIVQFKDKETKEVIKIDSLDINSLNLNMQQLVNYFLNLGIETEITEDSIIYDLNDSKVSKLIEDVIPNLTEKYNVYVSDGVKSYLNKKTFTMSVGVRITNNLLEVDVSSNEFTKEDINQILSAYKKKKKFTQLKSGETISLQNEEMDKLSSLINEVDVEFDDGKIFLPSYDAFKVDTLLDKSGADYHKEPSLDDFMASFEKIDLNDMEVKPKYLDILKPYQVTGVKWMMLLEKYGFGGILADDMGLGKTLQTIAYLESTHQEGQLDIVITPASLMFNWEKEIVKFGCDLKVVCIYGSALERENLIKNLNDYDIVITTYDYLKKDVEHLIKVEDDNNEGKYIEKEVNLYKDYTFNHIIIDEAQYIKNHNTQAAKAVKELNGKIRFALTGTPIENSLAELWSIFDYILPRYLYKYNRFKKEYETPIIKWEDKEQIDTLKKLVEPFILRRRKDQVLPELPDKVEITSLVSFDEEEELLYTAKLSEANTQLQEILEASSPNKILVLKILNELRQICCEPRLLYENIEHPSSKLNACLEIIENLIENDQKTLLFSSYTTMLGLIEEELKKHKIKYLKLTGDNTKPQREELVDKFQHGDYDVFLISLKAGGTGLNLTNASAVIHYDPWWNISAQNQATDRAHRIGQEKDVSVYNLIVKNTLEEKILKLQELKKNISDTFVEGSEGSISKMDADQIFDLLNREG